MIWNLFFFQIVRLSTAKRLMEVTKYKTGQVRDIESILARYEAEILETRTEIERGYKEPHLNYAFKPYYTQGDYIKIRGIYFSSYLSLDLVEVSSEIQSHIAWAYHCHIGRRVQGDELCHRHLENTHFPSSFSFVSKIKSRGRLLNSPLPQPYILLHWNKCF